MKNRILEYKKTDHFMLSQWDRNIDDQLLCRILPFVSPPNGDKEIVLVLPSFLKGKGFSTEKESCLIIIAKKNLLLTGYWCNHPNYLFNKEKNAHFQILYK